MSYRQPDPDISHVHSYHRPSWRDLDAIDTVAGCTDDYLMSIIGQDSPTSTSMFCYLRNTIQRDNGAEWLLNVIITECRRRGLINASGIVALYKRRKGIYGTWIRYRGSYLHG